jgi:hypothetical protein
MVSRLKKEIELVYGMPIRNGNQCHNLSTNIFEQTGEYISFQTLRRFFGFIDKAKQPTFKTLDILSKYCGFRDYDDFVRNSEKTNQHNLIELVYSIPQRKELDLNFHYVCRNLAHFLYLNLDKLNENLSSLVSSHVSHEYLFERFPFIDHINNQIYRRALQSYAKSKGTIDATIFTETLFYLANYLNTGSSARIPSCLEIKTLAGLHPFLQARVIGTFLLCYKKDTTELVLLAFKQAKKQNRSLSEEFRFPFFNYMMADYFIICKMYKEAITMIDLGRSDNSNPTGWLETGYYETLDLLYCIALEGSGNHVKALDLFVKINRTHFHFIFHKYFSIQYLNLKERLMSQIDNSDKAELDNLYRETKFHFL